jgi:hypothetical protein
MYKGLVMAGWQAGRLAGSIQTREQTQSMSLYDPHDLPLHMSGAKGAYLSLTIAMAGQGHDGNTYGEIKEWAHRLVAWAVYGPPTESQEVMHLCHNRDCLAPAHIMWASHQENMRSSYPTPSHEDAL